MCQSFNSLSLVFFLCLSFMLVSVTASSFSDVEPKLGSARVVFQTEYGDIEFGFYPNVAPITVDHIFKLVRLGCYNTNHFFRVDKGFVAQVADVAGGRLAPMNEEQRKEAVKKVIGEFSQVKHVRGILSMGRYEDPNSAQSSFSILLGDAPHLDGQYAIFGKVTKGDETLKKLEQLPTHREGIFVMPTKRITILSSYYYDTEMESCELDRAILKRRLGASAVEVERQFLPDNELILSYIAEDEMLSLIHRRNRTVGPNMPACCEGASLEHRDMILSFETGRDPSIGISKKGCALRPSSM